MNNNDTNFSQEYEPEEEKKTNSRKLEKEKTDFNVDEEKYGLDKPRRIIIKAKIIND
ncbi:hypothetical protein ISS30_05255 [bacterium]|nr:hypothetical protein [FCB group bacterium]MBL7191083.1 hypothetical protein [bacterium]